jgi:hypothetical protein
LLGTAMLRRVAVLWRNRGRIDQFLPKDRGYNTKINDVATTPIR